MQKILIIGTVWVEKTTGAGNRMWQLIKLFLENKWQITFVSTAQKTPHSINLSAYKIKEVTIELNSSSFDDFIKTLQPQIVLFDRFITEEQFGWRVAENCPKALRILDTEDLHFLRKTREKQFKKGTICTHTDLLKATDTKREIAAILRSDISLIISTFEMNLLKKLFKIDPNLLYHLPFLFDKIEEQTFIKWTPFKERSHFIFVGNFLHSPNIAAVIQLKNTIWKKIKKQLPNAELHIYGAYINNHINQLHNPKEGFLIKGFAKKINKVVGTAKVVLAPLPFGAGIKGKLTEAMLLGTPSVTTKIGAEGMCKNLPWSGFITTNPEDFITKAVTLYTDEKKWGKAQKRGISIINTLYNKELLSTPFIDTLLKLQQNLETHRATNFLGSLLQHHSMQSTKYLSKWIAIKNNTK